MIRFKILVMLLVLTSVSVTTTAQQAPMFTHYMNNTLVINPGYAGSRDALTVTALHRSQWVDFKGAPQTQTLTLHAPLRNEHIGLGLSVLNDKMRPTNNTSVMAAFAYKMRLNEKSNLSLGLSAGANMLQANLNTLSLDEQADPMFQQNVSNKVSPNVGFGVYYAMERFYAGISTPNLIQNSYSDGNQQMGKEQRHYFVIMGSMFTLSKNLAFKPTTLIKVMPAAPIQVDLTASFIIGEKLLLGAMYRTEDAMGFLAGFNITDIFHMGYSYDWSFGLSTGKYNKGSHELMLRYDFELFGKQQIHSPRYF